MYIYIYIYTHIYTHTHIYIYIYIYSYSYTLIVIVVILHAATIIGDPHIITLDGFKYTFNGKGEFLLIEHIDGRFTLQGRMISVGDAISSSSQQATVFSAVVGKQDDSDAVQFEINQQKNGIDVIVGGTRINLDGISKETFNNVVVFNLGDNGFAASFSSGCSIQVKEENGFISVFSVSVPLNFKSLTRGLMGNYNGDIEDDLMASNYTEPLQHNSTIEVIHNEFGITCMYVCVRSLYINLKKEQVVTC